MASQWSQEWPTTEGWYWFYGYPFGKNIKLDPNALPELLPVRVRTNTNSIFYIGGGAFIYKREGEGVWLPMITPPLPERS